MQVLSCQAVPRLELVEAGGSAFVGRHHCWIRLLHSLGRYLRFLGFIEPLLGPALGVRPLLPQKPALGIGQGSRCE